MITVQCMVGWKYLLIAIFPVALDVISQYHSNYILWRNLSLAEHGHGAPRAQPNTWLRVMGPACLQHYVWWALTTMPLQSVSFTEALKQLSNIYLFSHAVRVYLTSPLACGFGPINPVLPSWINLTSHTYSVEVPSEAGGSSTELFVR